MAKRNTVKVVSMRKRKTMRNKRSRMRRTTIKVPKTIKERVMTFMTTVITVLKKISP